MLAATVVDPGAALAQSVPTFHFESICRSDPATNKNTVTVTLHDEYHIALPGVTVSALWTFVDYRQNRAVFRYKPVACTTDADGRCKFSGGSGRARWQLSEVIGYDLGTPAFDGVATTLCPNSAMIDFW